MTDSETITFNECMSDRSYVHLCYAAEADKWQAFGLSAYMLERIAGNNCIVCIADYSYRMMMPSEIV